jgi:cytochrome o ubiquinol oxidase operon protein cyoD
MSDHPELPPMDAHDVAPGDEDVNLHELAGGLRGYLIGLALAVGLTVASFYLGGAHWLWAPSIPAALIVLAIAQMGVHLAFFLHIGTGPDNTNNILALAFGVLIVALVLFGSIWIMAHLNHNMVPTAQMMRAMP